MSYGMLLLRSARLKLYKTFTDNLPNFNQLQKIFTSLRNYIQRSHNLLCLCLDGNQCRPEEIAIENRRTFYLNEVNCYSN